MNRATAAAALLLGVLPAAAADAQTAVPWKPESGVTLYGGYSFGGGVTDSTTNQTISLADGSSGAVAIDIGLDEQSQIELFFNRQNTALTSGAFSPQTNNVGLKLNSYQLGGTYFIDGVGHGIYVMGGLGATTAVPAQGGLNSETYFSGNLGVGWMLPLGRHVGLRFETRGYFIAVNNSGALFCGGNKGCTISVSGTGIVQGEVLAGVSARF